MPAKQWSRLEEYRCVLPGCGAPLRKSSGYKGLHECSNVPKCPFRISDKRIGELVIVKHKKLEPPEFIKELRRQEELNNL